MKSKFIDILKVNIFFIHKNNYHSYESVDTQVWNLTYLNLERKWIWRLFPTVFFLTRLLKYNLTPYSAIFLCKATPAFVWRVPIQRNSGLKIRTTRATLRCCYMRHCGACSDEMRGNTYSNKTKSKADPWRLVTSVGFCQSSDSHPLLFFLNLYYFGQDGHQGKTLKLRCFNIIFHKKIIDFRIID